MSNNKVALQKMVDYSLSKFNLNLATQDGETALMLAAAEGFVDFVRLLLDSGADPTKKCKNGLTAAKYAETELKDDEKME